MRESLSIRHARREYQGMRVYRNDLHLICVSVLGYDYLELGLLGLGLLFM